MEAAPAMHMVDVLEGRGSLTSDVWEPPQHALAARRHSLGVARPLSPRFADWRGAATSPIGSPRQLPPGEPGLGPWEASWPPPDAYGGRGRGRFPADAADVDLSACGGGSHVAYAGGGSFGPGSQGAWLGGGAAARPPPLPQQRPPWLRGTAPVAAPTVVGGVSGDLDSLAGLASAWGWAGTIPAGAGFDVKLGSGLGGGWPGCAASNFGGPYADLLQAAAPAAE